MGAFRGKGGPTHAAEPKAKTSDSYADVSADGKWLVFVRTENKKAHLYVKATDGGGEARRVGSAGRNSAAVVAGREVDFV